MAELLRAAMLSKWHVHAEGYAKTLQNSGKVEIKAVWDDNGARGAEWAGRLGAEFMADLDALLARKDIDAVFCDAPTTAHKDILIKAANAHKHIFTEKALAPTMAECEEIKAAVEKAGVTFVISYPWRQRGVVQFAKREIEAGTFGQVSMIRVRDAHSGVSGHWLPDYWFEEKDTAGGAMMDLGCHPMYILAYLAGKPRRIAALFNSPLGSKVDENAVAEIEFKNGIIGVAETGFISYNSPELIEVYGTDATLIASGNDVRFKAKKLEPYENGYITPVLPKDKPLPLLQFVDACLTGTGSPEGLGIDDALALTELLEGAYQADRKIKAMRRTSK